MISVNCIKQLDPGFRRDHDVLSVPDSMQQHAIDPATSDNEAVAKRRKSIQRGGAENAKVRRGSGVRFP
jgi:hypothetical protein